MPLVSLDECTPTQMVALGYCVSLKRCVYHITRDELTHSQFPKKWRNDPVIRYRGLALVLRRSLTVSRVDTRSQQIHSKKERITDHLRDSDRVPNNANRR